MIILENKLSDGDYFAKVVSIEEMKTKKGLMYKVTYSTSDEQGNVFSWFEEKIYRNSIFCKLFEICDCTLETNRNYSIDELRDMFVGVEIGISIEVNEKDGRTYFNVVDIFEPADEDDEEEEEDEEIYDCDIDDDNEEDDESTEDEFEENPSVQRRDNIRYERGINSRRRRSRGY